MVDLLHEIMQASAQQQAWALVDLCPSFPGVDGRLGGSGIHHAPPCKNECDIRAPKVVLMPVLHYNYNDACAALQ